MCHLDIRVTASFSLAQSSGDERQDRASSERIIINLTNTVPPTHLCSTGSPHPTPHPSTTWPPSPAKDDCSRMSLVVTWLPLSLVSIRIGYLARGIELVCFFFCAKFISQKCQVSPRPPRVGYTVRCPLFRVSSFHTQMCYFICWRAGTKVP